MHTVFQAKVDARLSSRRNFLKFLAGSPLLTSIGSPFLSGAEAGSPLPAANVAAAVEEVISSPEVALKVFDFETAAKAKLPPAHWGYLATGVEGDATLRANREAFSKYHLRPRRLIDVRNIDQTSKLFGVDLETPILLAPVGSQKAFHRDGEMAVAKAAEKQRHQLILSSQTTTSVEDVIAARGSPVWYQLYPTSSWEVMRGLIKRAQHSQTVCAIPRRDLPSDEFRLKSRAGRGNRREEICRDDADRPRSLLTLNISLGICAAKTPSFQN